VSARLGRYAPWQARDYFIDRGVPTALVGSLFGYMVASAAMTRNANFTAAFLMALLGNFVFLGALFAMNGIVANDRKQGFYRFLFSKPLAPPRYYGQAFLVHWAGFLVVSVVLGLVYQGLVGPVLSVPLLITLALMYLCYAGIAFALSAAARWDWLSLVAMTVAANYLWFRYGESTSALRVLLYLFPPIHRTSEVYTAVARGLALPWHLLWWFAAYGAVSFIIGLVVLRYRRLAIV
jgi:hypothetical protein